MWLLITGNPVDGFTYYGPYNSSEAAADAGEQTGADWWIIKPTEPKGDKVTAQHDDHDLYAGIDALLPDDGVIDNTYALVTEIVEFIQQRVTAQPNTTTPNTTTSGGRGRPDLVALLTNAASTLQQEGYPHDHELVAALYDAASKLEDK